MRKYYSQTEKNEIRNIAAERIEKIAGMLKELEQRKNVAAEKIEKMTGMLKELEQKNRGYQEKFLENKLTWPEVGTMGHIVEMLEELTGKRG